MKIFFFTTVFAPSIGGIEKMAETLCREFVALGHDVRLSTMTPGNGRFPFPVIRRPSLLEFMSHLRWCDVHMQANVSLKHAWPCFVMPSKIIYRHGNAYQCDDGSLRLVDRIKTALARRCKGIANSHYTAARTGAGHVVFNGYEDAVFRITRPWDERDRDLVFLGRLVSQKGCDTLLQALARLGAEGIAPGLTVIGEGPDREMLEGLVTKLGLRGLVVFAGAMKGERLAAELNRHKVMVVPSRYEEPFGIVALEGLACGCIPLVSQYGGLVDAIGGHGFTFPNGDDAVLATELSGILKGLKAARGRLAGVDIHLARCSARTVAERYLEVFRQMKGVE